MTWCASFLGRHVCETGKHLPGPAQKVLMAMVLNPNRTSAHRWAWATPLHAARRPSPPIPPGLLRPLHGAGDIDVDHAVVPRVVAVEHAELDGLALADDHDAVAVVLLVLAPDIG